MPTYLEAYRAARARQEQADSSPAPAESTQSPLDRKTSTPKPPPSPGPAVSTPASVNKTAAPVEEDAIPVENPKSKPKAAKASPARQQTVKSPVKVKLDVPKQKGLWDSKDVRTKFARWQALDEPAEAWEEDDLPMEAGEEDGQATETDQARAEVDTVPAFIKPAVEKPGRMSTAPKKRIVSDEHWKTRPVRAAPAEQPKLPNLVIGEGLYVTPGGKKAEGWVRPMTTPSRKGRPGWVRTVGQASPTKNGVQTLHLRQRSKSVEIKRDHQRFATAVLGDGEIIETSREANPMAKDDIINKGTGSMEQKDRVTSADAVRSPKPRKAAPDPPKVWKTRPKPVETKPQPVTSPQSGSNTSISAGLGDRMAAWLTQTPDPFVEDIDDSAAHADRPRSVSDLGSMLAPRHTSVRRPEDNDSRHDRRRKSSGHENRSPVHSDEHSPHSPSPGLRGSRATKKASSPVRTHSHGAGYELAEVRSLDGELESRRRSKSHSTPNITGALQLALPSNGLESKRRDSRQGIRSEPTNRSDVVCVLSMPNDGDYRIGPARSSRTIEELTRELRRDETTYYKDLRTLVDGVIPVLLTTMLSRSDSAKGGSLPTRTKDVTMARDTIIDLGITLERLQGSHKRLLVADADAVVPWASRTHEIYAEYIRTWRLEFQDVIVNLAPADGVRASVGVLGDGNENENQRADVTYLLKRPLVRLKYLTRMMKSINQLRPSAEAARWAARFQDLVDEARVKQDVERARLEDETAAAIDPTRARTPETLTPLPGVVVRTNRCVRARDTFDLHLHHSSGQKVDCRVMLYLRTDDSGPQNAGDVLFSQTEGASSWLLFPPADLRQLSARRGDSNTNLIVMIRGPLPSGQEWHEIISLKTADENIVEEWLQLLGTFPVPPLSAKSCVAGGSVLGMLRNRHARITPIDDDEDLSELDLPLGEQSVLSSRSRPARSRPPRDARIEAWLNLNPSHVDIEEALNPKADTRSIPSSASNSIRPADSESGVSEYRPPANTFVRRAKNNLKMVFTDLQAPVQVVRKTSDRTSPRDRRRSSHEPPPRRQMSPIPSESFAIPKLRPSEISYTRSDPREDRPREPLERVNEEPLRSTTPDPGPLSRQRYHGRNQSSSPPSGSPQAALPPSPSQARGASTPHFTPTTPNSEPRRRSSSPLKYEYAPSSPSNMSSEMGDLMSDDEGSVTSESSVEEMLERTQEVTGSMKQVSLRSRPNSAYYPIGGSLSPSQSASQGPYEGVPQPETAVSNRTIASIFSWSDQGRWELLHPDECSIVVSPGLIEAFEMSAAHSRERREGKRPLIAQELTPLVPLRQGTAIDISIRSPPTDKSQIRTSNNIMFRSRTGKECDLLYYMINQARINNPRYLALQNARGPFAGGSGWASHMDRQANARGSTSWWRLGSKKSSYRASTRHHKTISVAETRSSVASMASAMSALKRFSAGSKMFNVGKSTISSRAGLSNPHSRSSRSWTSSAGSGESGASTPPVGHGIFDLSRGVPAGITEQKIRLYERESGMRWRDMGSARLTIMHPPRAASVTTAQLLTPSGHLKQEKRILVTGKTRGETLLDAILGETSFERVARTGLAVKIWERSDAVAKTGSVSTTRVRVFMIQMKSEAEAAYAFSLLGRLRY